MTTIPTDEHVTYSSPITTKSGTTLTLLTIRDVTGDDHTVTIDLTDEPLTKADALELGTHLIRFASVGDRYFTDTP